MEICLILGINLGSRMKLWDIAFYANISLTFNSSINLLFFLFICVITMHYECEDPSISPRSFV